VEISPDAVLGAIITVGLVVMASLWKLATMLAEVRAQVRPNGGSSLNDNARIAASEAVRAREMAERVASDLAIFRGHQAEDTAATGQVLGRLQHNQTNIKAGQEMLLEQQDALRVDIEDVRASARQATTAAGLAVGEAKAGRAVIGEHSASVRDQIGEVRQVVAALAAAVGEDQEARAQKERAYVAALNQIGVPLVPIADELEGGHS